MILSHFIPDSDLLHISSLAQFRQDFVEDKEKEERPRSNDESECNNDDLPDGKILSAKVEGVYDECLDFAHFFFSNFAIRLSRRTNLRFL